MATVAQVTITVSGGDVTKCGTLNTDQSLTSGQSLKSCNGIYTLTFQGDGNVVLYANGSSAIWATGTNGMTATLFAMQVDGNLVLYSRAPYEDTNAIWASGTTPSTGKSGGGTYGAAGKLVVQDDGNLVVYALSNNAVLWASGTAR